MRGKRGGPTHQELPPVNHWPGPGLSSASSSSSSSNCLDSGINRIREKSQKEIVSSSSSLEINKEEGKYDGEEKEEKERKMKKEEEVRRDKALNFTGKGNMRKPGQTPRCCCFWI
jgi:hypothetical protein